MLSSSPKKSMHSCNKCLRNQNDILAELNVFVLKKYDQNELFADLKIYKDDFIESKKNSYKKSEIEKNKGIARLRRENAAGENGLQEVKPTLKELTDIEFKKTI